MNVHIILAHGQYRTYIILPQTILGSTMYPLTFITGRKLTIYHPTFYPTTIAYVLHAKCLYVIFSQCRIYQFHIHLAKHARLDFVYACSYLLEASLYMLRKFLKKLL